MSLEQVQAELLPFLRQTTRLIGLSADGGVVATDLWCLAREETHSVRLCHDSVPATVYTAHHLLAELLHSTIRRSVQIHANRDRFLACLARPVGLLLLRFGIS